MTVDISITTTGVWHDLREAYEIPDDILLNTFDWLEYDLKKEWETAEGTSDRKIAKRRLLDALNQHGNFLKYQGTWYHLSQFSDIPAGSPLSNQGWHGYHPDGFTSGVVIQLNDEGEYRVGRYS